jgi:hypothetical protein
LKILAVAAKRITKNNPKTSSTTSTRSVLTGAKVCKGAGEQNSLSNEPKRSEFSYCTLDYYGYQGGNINFVCFEVHLHELQGKGDYTEGVGNLMAQDGSPTSQ